MKRKMRWLLYQLFGYALLGGVGILFFLPFVWMVSTSLKMDNQIFVQPPQIIPLPPTLTHYKEAIATFPFFRYFGNTLYYVVTSVVGTALSCSLVSYGLACVRWPGRKVLFYLTVATMMIPYVVIMIPLFMIFRDLGWIGTYNPLIIPAYFGSAFYIFLLRQFMMTVPGALMDAARIDGCSHLGIYWRIVIPLMKPALATVVLFEFMGRWNDFMGPLIYINDQNKFPLSMALDLFKHIHDTEWGNLMAASTLVVLPVLIIFFFTQRTFIEGIKLSGIKG